MSGSLSTTTTGGVVVWTIERPEVRNALDPPTLMALADGIEAASADADVGAAVITGAGDVCFSSGMDLKALRSGDPSVGPAVRRFQGAMQSTDRLPLVAAVRGMAMGGGFEIMLMCDLVVAADDAVFGLPEVKRGLVPGGGGTLLPSRLPIAVSLEIGLLGDPIDAGRAYTLGLVNRVVPTGDVLDVAVSLAARLADSPRATLRRIRQLMWATLEGGATANQAAAQASRQGGEGDEAARGVARFLSGER